MYRSRVRRTALATIAAVALIAGLTACTTDDDGGDAPAEDLQLNIQFTGPPISLNPALAAAGGGTPYTLLAYDPLIYMDADGNLVPDLATSWEFADADNTVFEMTIREGVSFASGAELDADAVVASMEYFLSAGGMMVPQTGPIEAVEAEGDVVRVTYSAPFPDAPITMTQYFQIGSIIGPDGLADPESLLTSTDGTGQYVYNADETVVDSVYVYDLNPNYWNPDAQVYDVVTMNVIADPNASLAAISTGQVDFATGSSVTAASAQDAGLDVVTAPNFIWGLQIVDRAGELNPALGDERVRQAIMLSLDREAIVEAIGADFTVVNGQTVNEGVPGWVSGLGEEYDPDAARELLAEAGYPDGFTLRTISATSMDPQSIIAQAIAVNLEAIGITVEIEVESTGLPRMLERSENREFETMVLPVSGRDAGVAIMDAIRRTNLNPWEVTDEEIQRLYSESQVAQPDERLDIFKQMNERWSELAWIIPAYSAQNIYYVAPSITNVRASGGNATPVPVGPAREYAWQPSE